MFFFFNDTATTEIYTLSLHDALPISRGRGAGGAARLGLADAALRTPLDAAPAAAAGPQGHRVRVRRRAAHGAAAGAAPRRRAPVADQRLVRQRGGARPARATRAPHRPRPGGGALRPHPAPPPGATAAPTAPCLGRPPHPPRAPPDARRPAARPHP